MDIGKKEILEEEWIPELLEEKNIILKCSKCGNVSKFYYRETTGATIHHDESQDYIFDGFEEEIIECSNCGQIIHRDDL